MHRYAGVAVAAVLFYLALTGIALNHPSLLGRSGGSRPSSVIAIDPTDSARLFRGGAWLESSTDGGVSWVEVTMPVPAKDVVDVAFAPDDPRDLWVVMRELGVLRSHDGGRVWERVDLGFTPLRDGVRLERIAIGPSGSVRLLSSAGEIVSADAGTSWTAPGGGPARPGRLHRLVHHLHTGYLVGPELVLVHDLAALGTLALAITGLIIWWKPFLASRRRRNGGRSRPDRTAPG